MTVISYNQPGTKKKQD